MVYETFRNNKYLWLRNVVYFQSWLHKTHVLSKTVYTIGRIDCVLMVCDAIAA